MQESKNKYRGLKHWTRERGKRQENCFSSIYKRARNCRKKFKSKLSKLIDFIVSQKKCSDLSFKTYQGKSLKIQNFLGSHWYTKRNKSSRNTRISLKSMIQKRTLGIMKEKACLITHLMTLKMTLTQVVRNVNSPFKRKSLRYPPLVAAKMMTRKNLLSRLVDSKSFCKSPV